VFPITRCAKGLSSTRAARRRASAETINIGSLERKRRKGEETLKREEGQSSDVEK